VNEAKQRWCLKTARECVAQLRHVTLYLDGPDESILQDLLKLEDRIADLTNAVQDELADEWVRRFNEQEETECEERFGLR
jgi:hypothetical protein